MSDPCSSLARRALLQGLGAALVVAPAATFLGCRGGQAGHATAAGGWASGGTRALVGAAPDPFPKDPSSTQALLCSMTLGPCYARSLEREDISEGYPGLPVRLAFLVVNEKGHPVPGATVDIWHTRNSGLYSGADAADMCTNQDADALAKRYFRGTQLSDGQGRVSFRTCYPGWYRGRCVHVHFNIRIGDREYLTSQLFYPDSLTAELFANHPDYKAFGPPDTTNATDSIHGGERYLLATEKQPDGSLLAWKTLVIRSSLADPECTVDSRGGPGGPPPGGRGGPPPGGSGGPRGPGGPPGWRQGVRER